MNGLERRALLGDKQAQEECTRQGIVLSCPFCGRNEGTIFKLSHSDLYAHKRTGKCVLDGIIIYNLADWNTRPEIERCRDCLYWTGTEADSVAPCRENKNLMFPKNGYCHQFSKKGE